MPFAGHSPATEPSLVGDASSLYRPHAKRQFGPHARPGVDCSPLARRGTAGVVIGTTGWVDRVGATRLAFESLDNLLRRRD